MASTLVPGTPERKGTGPPDPGHDGPQRPRVSICIPAYNEERNIGRLLTHLSGHPLRSADIEEVLIEVSGSTDGTPAIVAGWSTRWTKVRAVDDGRRKGLFQALQDLIARSRGEIVVRVDADVTLMDATLDLLVEALRDPGVGIASPRIVPLPSASRWVSAATRAEWVLHHAVSERDPKTTLVQAFWKEGVALPANALLEDAALQFALENSGRRPCYVADATIQISPPATIRGFLLQRIRTVRIIRTYVRRGYPVPPTASSARIAEGVFEVLRRGDVQLWDLGVFAMLEAAARVWARLANQLAGPAPGVWEPVDGTKAPDWTESRRQNAPPPGP